jgi:hypothetical protein
MYYGSMTLEVFASILLGENASTFCFVLRSSEQEDLLHMIFFGILQVSPVQNL